MWGELRTDISLSSRFKGINVIGAACACDRHIRCTQSEGFHLVDAVVDTRQVCLLHAIYPEGQMPIVAPIHFNRVGSITNVDIECVDKISYYAIV